MPLPDESRPGRASELIRRFQAAVDDTGEKPLTVSSSFAAPAAPPRPRQSGEGTGRKGKDQADGKEVVEAGEGKPLFFRSAGLKEKPAVPVEQQGRKNAKEAFPDMQEAPKAEEVAREMEADASKKEEEEEESSPSAKADESAPEPSQPTENPPAHPASPPHPVVTQPSLDVPPSVPIPGSTDLLSSPSSPAPATEHEEQERKGASSTPFDGRLFASSDSRSRSSYLLHAVSSTSRNSNLPNYFPRLTRSLSLSRLYA
ncbi:hypothetical protein RTBOTA2_002213 [Rhodotorula toruloides]|nr:hypothetical protein RTBOTA2_002213 [Rhodotorula toruloides]